MSVHLLDTHTHTQTWEGMVNLLCWKMLWTVWKTLKQTNRHYTYVICRFYFTTNRCTLWHLHLLMPSFKVGVSHTDWSTWRLLLLLVVSSLNHHLTVHYARPSVKSPHTLACANKVSATLVLWHHSLPVAHCAAYTSASLSWAGFELDCCPACCSTQVGLDHARKISILHVSVLLQVQLWFWWLTVVNKAGEETLYFIFWPLHSADPRLQFNSKACVVPSLW